MVTLQAFVQLRQLYKLSIWLLSGDELEKTPAAAGSQYSFTKQSVTNSDTEGK